jgi:DNA helicase-2/ATP-dependent DNA helicase PcrA
MRKLFLFRAEDRLFQGRWQHSLPSRFIKEIPPQLLEAEFPPSAPTRAFAGYGKGGEFSSDLPRTGADATQADTVMPPGTRVLHSEFGSGVVIGVAPQGKWHKVTVKFQHWGQKKLILELARLEVLK